MEDRIKQLLDRLDEDETERLLDGELPVVIDRRTAATIRKRVFARAGFQAARTRRLRYRFAAVAVAAIVIASAALASVGLETVAAAFGKLFGYAPGHGIVDGGSAIMYTMETPEPSAENDAYRLTLKSAVATRDTVSVFMTLARKANAGSGGALSEEDKQKQLEQAAKPQEVTLETEGRQYAMSGWSRGSGGQYDTVSGSFVMKDRGPAPGEYRLRDSYSGLTVTFRLRTLDRFESLDQIGPTVYHKELSLTAVSDRTDDRVTINLYPIRTGAYKPVSFTRDPYNDELSGDLHLATDRGNRPYRPAEEPYIGPRTEFAFDVKPDENGLALVIPYVTVESEESAAVALTIPPMGQTRTVNKTVSFRDSTVTIRETAKVMYQPPSGGTTFEALRIQMAFHNKRDRFELNRLYLSGANTGGFGWEFDDSGAATTYYYSLVGYDKGSPRLELQHPQYLITDGFTIPLRMGKQG